MGYGKGAAELYCSLAPPAPLSCLDRAQTCCHLRSRGSGEVTVLWFPPRALLFCRECSTGRLCSLKSALWKELLGGSYKEECRMLPLPPSLSAKQQDPLGQGLEPQPGHVHPGCPDAKEAS